MRCFISRAALLVKVTDRISPGRARPVAEDMRDAGRQHAGLAGSRTGQHQNRSVQRFHGLALFRIEPAQISWRCRGPRARSDAAGGGLVLGNVAMDQSTWIGHANRLSPR